MSEGHEGSVVPGWVRDDDGRLRRELKPHMGRRLPGFDYSQRRIYEITIVLEERRPFLGRLVQNGDDDWAVAPSAAGEAVLDCWREIPVRWPQIKLIECALMPDHFHGVLFVKEALPKGKSLGNIIGGFKGGCTIAWRKLAGSRSVSAAKHYEAKCAQKCSEAEHYEAKCAQKCSGAASRAPAATAAGTPQWAEGYVDVILSGKGQLDRMIAYLRDNPRRLGIKRANPGLFKVRRELKIDGIGRFSAIGNHFLLSSPRFHQIQVSRRYFAYACDGRGNLLKDNPPKIATREYEEKLTSALAAADEGAVLISPCISQGEREIARQAFRRGARLITLSNKGFSPLYKPGGMLFEKCASGNLLMLAPIAWPYQVAEKSITRMDALILNRIAQMIAREDACEIDYKGMNIANVDCEVRKMV